MKNNFFLYKTLALVENSTVGASPSYNCSNKYGLITRKTLYCQNRCELMNYKWAISILKATLTNLNNIQARTVFCDYVVIWYFWTCRYTAFTSKLFPKHYHATTILLRCKLFLAATSIWESASLQISKGLLLLAIFHLLDLQLLTADQRGFKSQIISWAFENAWIIVGGYSSVIKGHRALIGQRLSQFGHHAYAVGNPVSQSGCESDISLSVLAGHPH